MVTEVLAKSPAGPIEAVPNLKRRKQRVYWRPHTNPDGTVEWLETRPLPDDLGSREQYLAKGFRLSAPKPGESQSEPGKTDTEKENLYAEIAQLREELKSSKRKKGA